MRSCERAVIPLTSQAVGRLAPIFGPVDGHSAGGRASVPLDSRAFSGTHPLVNSYAHDFSQVRSLFVGNSSDREAWRATIGRVLASRATCGTVAPVVVEQLRRRHAPAEALEAAASLASAGTVAIVTGQQAGLFGGPLYTLLKAINAIQLARWVEVELRTPAVPVFWVEAEDHDWAEVRSTAFLDGNSSLRHATAADPPGAGLQAVAALQLVENDPALSVLASELPRTEFSDDILARLRRHYRSGVGIARAFAGLMDDLLGTKGLVVFEANEPAAKALVADIFAPGAPASWTHCRTRQTKRVAPPLDGLPPAARTS